MELRCENIDDIYVLTVTTESLDAFNAQEFQRMFLAAVPGNAKTLLDIGRMRFVDSSGLGAVLTCRHRLREGGGDLKLLCDRCRPVRMFFEMVRIHRLMPILDTRQQALESFHHVAVE